MEPHGVERVAVPEERLHVQHRDHQLAHDERGERREEQELGEEDARAGLEKRERAEKVQPLRQAVEVPRDELHAVPAGDLEVELVRAVEGHFASLAHHHEPHVLHAAAAQHQVHAAEDVLAQVQLPRSLGDAALPTHPPKVPHVGVPVVEPHVQGLRQEALDDRAEHLLRERGERRHRAAAVGDHLLGEAHQARRAGERRQRVAHLERLRQLAVLIHVDRLQVQTGREGHAEVLVLGLALAHDREAGETHAVRLAHRAGRVRHAPRREPNRRRRVVESLRLVVDFANFAVRGDDAEVRVLAQQLLQVLVVLLVALRAVHLRAHHVAVLDRHQRLYVRLGHTLQPRQHTRRVGVRRHAARRAQHGLRAPARPLRDFAKQSFLLRELGSLRAVVFARRPRRGDFVVQGLQQRLVVLPGERQAAPLEHRRPLRGHHRDEEPQRGDVFAVHARRQRRRAERDVLLVQGRERDHGGRARRGRGAR